MLLNLDVFDSAADESHSPHEMRESSLENENLMQRNAEEISDVLQNINAISPKAPGTPPRLVSSESQSSSSEENVKEGGGEFQQPGMEDAMPDLCVDDSDQPGLFPTLSELEIEDAEPGALPALVKVSDDDDSFTEEENPQPGARSFEDALQDALEGSTHEYFPWKAGDYVSAKMEGDIWEHGQVLHIREKDNHVLFRPDRSLQGPVWLPPTDIQPYEAQDNIPQEGSMWCVSESVPVLDEVELLTQEPGTLPAMYEVSEDNDFLPEEEQRPPDVLPQKKQIPQNIDPNNYFGPNFLTPSVAKKDPARSPASSTTPSWGMSEDSMQITPNVEYTPDPEEERMIEEQLRNKTTPEQHEYLAVQDADRLSDEINCPACTLLNHITNTCCSMCGNALQPYLRRPKSPTHAVPPEDLFNKDRKKQAEVTPLVVRRCKPNVEWKMQIRWNDGYIKEVAPDGQAHALKIETGWQIVKIDNEEYNEELMQLKMLGNAPYFMTFCTKPTQLKKVHFEEDMKADPFAKLQGCWTNSIGQVFQVKGREFYNTDGRSYQITLDKFGINFVFHDYRMSVGADVPVWRNVANPMRPNIVWYPADPSDFEKALVLVSQPKPPAQPAPPAIDFTNIPPELLSAQWSCPNCTYTNWGPFDCTTCEQNGRMTKSPFSLDNPMIQDLISCLTPEPEPEIQDENGWHCPECNTLNSDDVIMCARHHPGHWKCSSCDAAVSRNYRICTSCGQDRTQHVEVEADMWQCQTCTVLNEKAAMMCQACDTLNPNSVFQNEDILGGLAPAVTSWTCDRCTLVNSIADPLCTACANTRPVGLGPVSDIIKHQAGTWICSRCELEVPESDDTCFNPDCRTARREDEIISWNCGKCTVLNHTPLDEIFCCQLCGEMRISDEDIRRAKENELELRRQQEEKERRKQIARDRRRREEERRRREEERRRRALEERRKKMKELETLPSVLAMKERGYHSTYGTMAKCLLEILGTVNHPSSITKFDLLKKFLAKFAEFKQQIGHPDCRIVYHWTNQRNFDAIEENGLLIPDGRRLQVANGSAHGLGIYSSEDPNQYSRFGQGAEHVFACISVLGKSSSRHGRERAHADFDATVTGSIIVFYDEAQICPVFLLRPNDIVLVQHLYEFISDLLTKWRVMDVVLETPEVEGEPVPPRINRRGRQDAPVSMVFADEEEGGNPGPAVRRSRAPSVRRRRDSWIPDMFGWMSSNGRNS